MKNKDLIQPKTKVSHQQDTQWTKKNMNHKITHDIDRISLHDSAILSYEFLDNTLILKFNWAYITHYQEKNLGPLVLGNCQLKLIGILTSSLLEEFCEEKKNDPTRYVNKITSCESFLNGLVRNEVLENISQDDYRIVLSGFVDINHDTVWASWLFEFESFEFSWNNYVTREEWKNHATPSEPEEILDVFLKISPSFKAISDDEFSSKSQSIWFDEDGELLIYTALGSFATHIVEQFKMGHTEEFETIFTTVESLLTAPETSEFTKECIVIGLLEGIQNQCGNNNVDTRQLTKFLKPETMKYWQKLNDFWSNIS